MQRGDAGEGCVAERAIKHLMKYRPPAGICFEQDWTILRQGNIPAQKDEFLERRRMRAAYELHAFLPEWKRGAGYRHFCVWMMGHWRTVRQRGALDPAGFGCE